MTTDPRRHVGLVTALSKPGQPLAVDAPTATINNRDWFKQSGKPQETRGALHNQLIADQFHSFPNVVSERKAIILAGPPGAGKSTTLAKALRDQATGFLHIDPDEFKTLLLHHAVADGSYETWLKPDAIKQLEAQGERFFPMELATLVHEESSILAHAMRRDALTEGHNVVIDTVLKSPTSAREIAHALTQANYSIEIIDVEVPEAVSQASVQQRWLHGYQTALQDPTSLGGRWVPSEYIHHLYDRPDGKSWPEHTSENLAHTTAAVTRYRRYRARTTTGERTLELDLHRTTPGLPLRPSAPPHRRPKPPSQHLGHER